MAEQPQRIKAIETRYAGCRFRSRLEARWAVFFNTLSIRWEYEPEGFVVDGRPYLPDFRLPDLKRWVEVKGDPEDLDITLIKRFAYEANVQVLILGPMPPASMLAPCWISLMGWPELMEYMPEIEGRVSGVPWTWDRCVPVYREFFDRENGLQMRASCGPPKPGEPKSAWITPQEEDYAHEYPPRLPARAAYDIARSARFEHGQHG